MNNDGKIDGKIDGKAQIMTDSEENKVNAVRIQKRDQLCSQLNSQACSQPNAKLNPTQVMGVDDSHIGAVNISHSLHPLVIEAFISMQSAAGAAGIDLQICSSFRNFDKQLSIWDRKWRGELPLLNLQDEIIDPASLSEIEKVHAIMLWSALPGASRHHWGTDFDIYDKAEVDKRKHHFELVPSEYENNGPCAKLSQWINTHCHEFGFYLPYKSYVGGVAREPWHLSYKPLADEIIKQFSITALHAQLNSTNILGKSVILDNLDMLVKRYTLNKGI